MAKPKRTFTGQEGQRSVGTAGPDAIRYDLDNLFAALDPDDTFKDGTSGGIGEENLRQVTIDQADEPTGNTGHIRQLFSWLANIVRKITGNANWYDAPKTTLTATKAHMDANTGVHGVGASTVESVAGAQSKVDVHEAKAATHGATASATANRIVLRDSSGRAQIATPTLASDIANKSYVDGKISEVDVVGDVSGHINRTDAHSATNTATANRIMMRDAYGRAKVAVPSASDDIARKAEVDTVQTNLTTHANTASPHSGHATTAALSSHASNKQNPHAVTAAQAGAAPASHTHPGNIVEMGSNANGHYIKWENGLLECFHTLTGGGAGDFKTIQELKVYTCEWTWAYPITPVTIIGGGASGYAVAGMLKSYGQLGTYARLSTVEMYVVFQSLSNWSTGCDVYVWMVGTWK